MQEIIVRMDMPESCAACPVEIYGCCGITNENVLDYFGSIPKKRPQSCPIIGALPSNHGDLVDFRDLQRELDRIFCHIVTDEITGMQHKEYPTQFLQDHITLPIIIPKTETGQKAWRHKQ